MGHLPETASFWRQLPFLLKLFLYASPTEPNAPLGLNTKAAPRVSGVPLGYASQ
mgnify:CR=1 FL=1|jgi:hypothetical protein